MITGVISPWNIHNAHNYSYIPFIDFELRYFLLNLALFLPTGCFLHLLLNKKTKFSFLVILIGVIITICIELIQLLFTGRLADIDDIIANSLGLIIGYLIFLFIYRTVQSHCSHPFGIGTFSIFISFIGIVFGFPYRYPLCLGDMICVRWGILL